MKPKVEFIQGIPVDLEHDSYFDPQLRNMIILDDLMSTASKDPRINDLFTEGSHHRNLSVIILNQNLYFGRDPTQRRNCHYLVLFNNPIDKQQIMTLARQMYPGNVSYFTQHFNDAVDIPFGHLLVDLKPTTEEKNRLCKNAFRRFDESDIAINTSQNSSDTHSVRNSPSNQVCNIVMESCDDCGTVFDSKHDVQRHIRENWCPAKIKRGHPHKRDDSPPPKRRFYPETDNSSDEEDIEDVVTFQNLWHRAKRECESEWENRVRTYMDDGQNEDKARQEANEDVKEKERRVFFKLYIKLLEQLIPLRNSPTHKKIVEAIEKRLDKNEQVTLAVRKGVKKFKADFEDLFNADSESENETGSENESEEMEEENSSD